VAGALQVTGGGNANHAGTDHRDLLLVGHVTPVVVCRLRCIVAAPARHSKVSP
jgi:hypothetical protein